MKPKYVAEEVKCSACRGPAPTVRVRERVPGSKGGMAKSFVGSYYLCHPCLDRCRGAGAIQLWEQASKKPRRAERVTVYARTFQWLKVTSSS